MLEPNLAQVTILHSACACVVDHEGYKNTSSEYVILAAFPLDQSLGERSAIITACFVATHL